jgi:AcrR family transcriptional regulator
MIQKMDNIKKPWILIGYDIFSKDGKNGLKVEVIARLAKKSKSSFYHHFAEMDLFIEDLLAYHLERAKIISDRERLCKTMVPDVLNLLLEFKQDLLFNRQLRVNRHILTYKNCFEKANLFVEDAILDIWSEALGLSDKTYLSRIIFNLTIENFYLQITEETFTYDWLLDYFNNIRLMVTAMKNSK